MNVSPPTIARALVALAVSLMIPLAFVACSGDEDPQQVPSQVQHSAEEAAPRTVQEADEAQQQSQASSASAGQQTHEQQEVALQSAEEQQQQQAEQEAAQQQQEEQQAAPEASETPAVSPSETFFQDYEESVWAQTEADDTVTFALDADQASWALALNHARHGYQIDPASVRAEEWINAQYYAYPFPESDNEFGLSLDLIEHPLDPDRLHLLRIGLQAPIIEDRSPLNVTFVLDASYSMAEGNRVELVQAAIGAILASLDVDDWAAIVQFSADVLPAWLVPHTRSDSEFLKESVERLRPFYGTNVQAGLNLGVELAQDARLARPHAHNYIILMSDGVANVDATDPFAILESAYQGHEDNPFRLITVGVGIGHYNDVLLEQLAQYGNGWYYYLESEDQAWETFSTENWLRLTTPFADQTRAQLRWNAETVRAWRVIGYENRRTSDESFADEREEFAELSSGAAVTIFVELELTEQARAEQDGSLDLGALEVRWQAPRSDESNRQESTLAVGVDAEPDSYMRLGAIVALAADRYGSLDHVGDEATPKVNAAIVELLGQLRNVPWPTDADQESLAQVLWLLETMAADTSR